MTPETTTTDATTTEAAPDPAGIEAFLERFLGDLAATAHAATVVLGDRLGLYRALADGGAQSPEELAARAGCHPRLVEEWLNAQAASGYCAHDPATGRYRLTPEQAACLADPASPVLVAPGMRLASSLHKDEERLAGALGGDARIGWHEHHPDLFCGMEQLSRGDYSALVPEWIPALDGVGERLAAGARVADVGCGHGAALIMLAEAYPSSTFHGFDYHERSVEAARHAASAAGVSDRVTFETAMADAFPGDGYDLVCTLDAVHDMGDPVAAARRIRRALAPGGVWLLVEPRAGDEVSENLGVVGRMFYSSSTLLCVPNALAQGASRPLGAQAGEAALRAVASEAGFTRFRRVAETPLQMVLEARA